MSGGVVASASAITLLILPRDCSNSGYFAASFWEKAEISCADLLHVLIERERAAIGRKRRHADFGSDQHQPVLFELHVPNDIRQNRTQQCGLASSIGIPDEIRR